MCRLLTFARMLTFEDEIKVCGSSADSNSSRVEL